MTAFALNHVNTVFRAKGNVVSKRSCFVCRMECVRSRLVGYVEVHRRNNGCRFEKSLGEVCCFVKDCVIKLVQESCRGCCGVGRCRLEYVVATMGLS